MVQTFDGALPVPSGNVAESSATTRCDVQTFDARSPILGALSASFSQPVRRGVKTAARLIGVSTVFATFC